MAKTTKPTRQEKADMAARDLLAHMRESPDDRTIMDEMMTAFRMGQESIKAGQPRITDADAEAVRLKYLNDRLENTLAALKAQAETCMAEHAKLKETMALCVQVARKAELVLGLGKMEETTR